MTPPPPAPSAPATPGDVASTLERVRTRLEALLGESAPEMQTSAAHALGDELILCGIVGGKDVGKTTLLRALIGLDRSATPESSEGTSKLRFYVHRDQVLLLNHRFPNAGFGSSGSSVFDLLTHDHDALRALVLVDLPDFDSEYREHLRVVEQTLPQLDRIVWLMSPRKAADRSWLQLFHRYAKDGSNVYYALSKGDELVADTIPLAGSRSGLHSSIQGSIEPMASQRHWFRQQLDGLVETLEPDRLFVVAAAHAKAESIRLAIATAWDDGSFQNYSAEYSVVQQCADQLMAELNRLRKTLLHPISRESVVQVKLANRRAAVRHDIERIRSWSRMDLWRERIGAVVSPENQELFLTGYFSPELRSQLAASLLADLPGEGEAAADLFAWRADRYPMLRLFSHPMSALARRVTRSVAGRQNLPSGAVVPSDRRLETDLHNSVARLRANFVDENQTLLERFRLTGRLPGVDSLASALSSQISQLRRAVAEDFSARLRERVGRRSWMLVAFLIGATLWFPLIQPLTEAGVLILGADRFSTRMQSAAKLIAALGPTKLLQGLLVVLLIYSICLAAIFRRSLRDVRQLQSQWVFGLSSDRPRGPEEELLQGSVIAALVDPLVRVGEEIAGLDQQLREAENRHEP